MIFLTHVRSVVSKDAWWLGRISSDDAHVVIIQARVECG